MNNKIKALILIGSISLFSEVFRLVNSARVDLDNKNACVQYSFKKYVEDEDLIYGGKKYTEEESRAFAYTDCTK